MMPEFPWKIVELPFRDSTKPYKEYPNGGSVPANDEDMAVWACVQALRASIEALCATNGALTDRVVELEAKPAKGRK